MIIPSMLLKRLYTFSSLKNVPGGVQFSVKNRLSDASLMGITRISINKVDVPWDMFTLETIDGEKYTPGDITPESPLQFPLREEVLFNIQSDHLPPGKHRQQAL